MAPPCTQPLLPLADDVVVKSTAILTKFHADPILTFAICPSVFS